MTCLLRTYTGDVVGLAGLNVICDSTVRGSYVLCVLLYFVEDCCVYVLSCAYVRLCMDLCWLRLTLSHNMSRRSEAGGFYVIHTGCISVIGVRDHFVWMFICCVVSVLVCQAVLCLFCFFCHQTHSFAQSPQTRPPI
jgi:hypothetical protein